MKLGTEESPAVGFSTGTLPTGTKTLSDPVLGTERVCPGVSGPPKAICSSGQDET